MTAYNWNSEIENDGGDFKLLEPGIYPFTVKALEKAYFNGSKSIPPCPKANVTLRVGVGSEASDVTDGLLLDDSLEWKLCQFFKAIGDRAHGQRISMNWDAVVGKSGRVEIGHREYEKDGQTKTANQVIRYIDPSDPTVASPQQQRQAAPQAVSASW